MKLLKIIVASWILVVYVLGSENLYEILGVKRSDSKSTIKKAFRELALKWHPDRNKDPKAEEEMIKINTAFQILSDPDKKKRYDNYGTVDGDNHKQWTAEDIFQQFRGPGGQYSFMFEDMPFGSFYNSHDDQKVNVLNEYNYNNIVLQDSYHKPFLIYVVSDICFDCLKYRNLWKSICENFETIGIGTYELNYHRDRKLYEKIGANKTPQFIAVVNGRQIKYKGDMTERGVREFISTILPHHLIDHFEDEREYFEQSFLDNKPQVLLFSRHMYPPLLYQVVAFEYHNKVKFAYVYTKDRKTSRLCEKYNVAPDQPTVLILKEEPSAPVVVARGTALKRGTLRKLVARNLYFFVPRLSSNNILDEMCPKKYASSRTLCYVLLTTKNTNFNTHLWKFREYAKNEDFLKEKRAQFLYIYENVQTDFVKSFSEGFKDYMVPCSDGSLPLKLLVFWRQQNDKVKYEWYPSGWCKDSGKEELYEYIDDRSSNQVELQYETEQVRELQDEHWNGHVWDAIKKTYSTVQNIVDSFDHPSWTNPASIFFLILILMIILVGFVMPYVGEMNTEQDLNDGPGLPRHTSGEVCTTVLNLTKFDYKNQKELLHNSPPGCMTIAVLVDTLEIDQVAQSPIIQTFADITYPYSMNVNYKFVWLSLAENLVWCNELINSNKFGEFPPGSVIAFNGFRKYFFIYRPNTGGDHPEFSANFLGFEESDDEDPGNNSLERARVKRAALRMREELACWLDRILEGTFRDKKRIDKWPDMEAP